MRRSPGQRDIKGTRWGPARTCSKSEPSGGCGRCERPFKGSQEHTGSSPGPHMGRAEGAIRTSFINCTGPHWCRWAPGCVPELPAPLTPSSPTSRLSFLGDKGSSRPEGVAQLTPPEHSRPHPCTADAVLSAGHEELKAGLSYFFSQLMDFPGLQSQKTNQPKISGFHGCLEKKCQPLIAPDTSSGCFICGGSALISSF